MIEDQDISIEEEGTELIEEDIEPQSSLLQENLAKEKEEELKQEIRITNIETLKGLIIWRNEADINVLHDITQIPIEEIKSIATEELGYTLENNTLIYKKKEEKKTKEKTNKEDTTKKKKSKKKSRKDSSKKKPKKEDKKKKS